MKRRNFLRTAAFAGMALPSVLRQAAAKPCPPPTVNATGGSSVNTSCVAPAGQPQYMKGMADFEVRTLPTVTGGFPTMFSTLPAEWQQTGQPNGADNVLSSWGGGAGDPTNLKLYVHGGGHHDSSNNGLYVYDFNGTTAPVGWSIAPNTLSRLSAVVVNTEAYTDGLPTAIHPYGGLWYDNNKNRFYRFGGCGFTDAGAATTAAWYYDVAAQHWVHLVSDESTFGAQLGADVIGSPDGNMFLWLPPGQPTFIDPNTAALKPYGNTLTGSLQSGPAPAWDTNRSNLTTGVCRYVIFYTSQSNSPSVFIVTVNWPAKTFTTTLQALSGTYAADLDYSGASVAYDAQRDSFWVFANDNSMLDGQMRYIYEVNAATFAVTRNTLSTPVQTIVYCRGSFNRHVWFSNWRVIGTVHAHDQPMSLIKVPN